MAAHAQALGLTQTSIGKKLLMAVTGSILVLFVIGHMAGNLQFYLGPEAIDAYARALRRFPPLLWTVRAVLFLCAAVHINAALQTTVTSWRSRERYRHGREYRAATWSSRTMRISGLLLLGFILYHVAHLTFGATNPAFVEGDVYGNIITGFSDPLAAGVYVVTMVFLGTHMLHGIWSLFQTFGTNSARWTARLRMLALTVTALVVLGNISIPLSVLAKWVG